MWGYSRKKFGAQQSYAPNFPDAGNGFKTNGDPIEKGDPNDTSIPIDPQFVGEWLDHLKQVMGGKSAANGGVKYFELGNEPMLWSETHRDIRYGDKKLSNPRLGRQELWKRTEAYGKVIKAKDPAAKTLGPSVFGWCAYFGSAQDIHDSIPGCKNGYDRQRHGNLALIPWYLKQVCEYKKKHGVRLVDYLDIHYYPENNRQTEDPEMADLRLSSFLKSLYDPNAVDPSWIGEPVMLIPRLALYDARLQRAASYASPRC